MGDWVVVDWAATAVEEAAVGLVAVDSAAVGLVAVDSAAVDLDSAAAGSAAEDSAADSEAVDSAVDLEAVEAAGLQRVSKPKRDQRRCCSRSIQPRSVLRHLKLRRRHRRCHLQPHHPGPSRRSSNLTRGRTDIF